MAWLYTAAGVILLPWIVYLAVTLPRRQYDRHYRLAWVGFDLILVLAISRTAYMAFRFDPRDAWFDVTTSSTRGQVLEALVLAVLVEIPAALFTLYLAHSVNERILSLAHLDRARAPTRQHWWTRLGARGSTIVVEEVPNDPVDREPGVSG